VNDKLEMFWKKAVVAYFKMLSQDLPGGAEKNHENISQDCRSLSQDLDPASPEYEAGS
jgi:hypothetical protein